MECIQAVNYSIVINGEHSRPFNAPKGLRQGDPISFFLFAVIMEYLSRSLKDLKVSKEYKYHPRCSKLGITHLCFADNLLLFARGDAVSVNAIYSSLQYMTCKQIRTSSVYFGEVTTTKQQKILLQLGFIVRDLPFKYLGVPLSTKKMSIMQWQPLIDKMTSRISSWTVRNRSYVRRIQLVQSVLFGIQAFWAQLFIILAKVIKIVESICRSYVWSKANVITKKALLAWDKVFLPKAGGIKPHKYATMEQGNHNQDMLGPSSQTR
uniref:Uncharacterized protein LOC104218307 n=1 Tax=Nicotiana sylvestris TaxID=4096 RepID=A0A1U7VG61_NICSY|nr:PREDICTED: uncharacterized protein LOC104218307 [Nicotiana sylvestris]